MLGRLSQGIRKDLPGKYKLSLLWRENGVEGDNGEKQPLDLLVALRHMVQLFPITLLGRGHHWLPLPGEGSDPAAPALADACTAPLTDSWSWLSLLYPCCPWEQGRGTLHVSCYLHFPHLPAPASHLKRLRPSYMFPVVSRCLDQFILLSSFIFSISPPPHLCALCSKTAQFLFWPYLLCSETQPPSSSGLDLLVLFATFHMYFCSNCFDQLCYCHIHCNTITSQLAKPDPFSEFCSFFTLSITISFACTSHYVKNYFLL